MGAVWTRTSTGAILRNGDSAAGGVGSEILYCNRIIYVLGTDSQWWRWNSGWTPAGFIDPCSGGTPTPTPSPAPTPTPSEESANNTRVPPATQIVDSTGAVWTRTANGTILRNGAGTGGTGSQILYCNRIVYVLGTDSQWWRWNGGWTPVGFADPCAGVTPTPTPTPTPPTVSSVLPASGPTFGGTSITITGTGFLAGATVSLGGTFASNVTVVNSTSITALTPAHTAGPVDVTVQNPEGQSGSLVNGYTFALVGDTLLLVDDFNNGSIDNAKWISNNLYSGFTDSTVAVRETQWLEIGPLKQNVDGSHYNGIKSGTAYDLSGGYAQVQIVQAANSSTAADAFFTLGLDVNNCYRIYVESGMLFLQAKLGGSKRQAFTVVFDPVNHAFWRLRHDATSGNIVFETAPANGGVPGPWAQRYAEAWNTSAVPLNNVLFELKAGTWRRESSSPGTVIFDNFTAAKP